MENKQEGTINIIALLLVIAFTVLSCFACFEFYFTRRSDIADDPTVTISLVEVKTNNIPVVLALGVLQAVCLCIKQRTTRLLSVWCSVGGVLVTGYEVVQNLMYSTFQSMGGLGWMDYKITIVGYCVIALSLVNMLVQIVSVKKKKEGNEQ